MPMFRAVSTRYAARPFYLMSDVVCDVFAQIISEFGGSAYDGELLALEAPYVGGSDSQSSLLESVRRGGLTWPRF